MLLHQDVIFCRSEEGFVLEQPSFTDEVRWFGGFYAYVCVCFVVVVVRLLTSHFSIATFFDDKKNTKVLQEIVVNARINQKRPRIPYFQGESENDSEQSSESQPILTDDFVDKVGPTIIDEVSCKGILLSL